MIHIDTHLLGSLTIHAHAQTGLFLYSPLQKYSSPLVFVLFSRITSRIKILIWILCSGINNIVHIAQVE